MIVGCWNSENSYMYGVTYIVDVVLFLQQITTWVSPEIEDERRNFPKMSQAIPVVLGYVRGPRVWSESRRA